MSQIVSWRLNKGMRSKYPSCYTAHGHTQLCHWKISTKFSWEGRNVRPRLSIGPAKYTEQHFVESFIFLSPQWIFDSPGWCVLPFLLLPAPPAGTGRVTALSPIPSHFSIVTSHLQLLLGRGWFLQTISSVYSAFSSSCIWSFLNVQCPLDRDLTSPKLGCWNWQQHVGNVLCTVLVMKENFSFNSKTFSCSEPVLRHALSFLVVQPPRTLILGAHGNTQSLSEGEFCPPLPQRDDEKVTPVSTPLLICPQRSELSHLWECEVLSRFSLLLIALDSLRRVEGSLSSDSLWSTN